MYKGPYFLFIFLVCYRCMSLSQLFLSLSLLKKQRQQLHTSMLEEKYSFQAGGYRFGCQSYFTGYIICEVMILCHSVTHIQSLEALDCTCTSPLSHCYVFSETKTFSLFCQTFFLKTHTLWAPLGCRSFRNVLLDDIFSFECIAHEERSCCTSSHYVW